MSVYAAALQAATKRASERLKEDDGLETDYLGLGWQKRSAAPP